MSEVKHRHPPSRRRRVFRFCGKCALLLLLATVCLVVYLNQVGLPGFVKSFVLARLERRGIRAEFERVRWRWPDGIVVENLTLRRNDAGSGPEFHSTRAGVRLNFTRWFWPRWRIDSITVREGMFSWVLPEGSGLEPLAINAIDADLGIDADGALDLRHFTSRFRDLQLEASGTFEHPEALARPRDTNAPPANLELLNRTMTQVANYLTNFEFAAAPALRLRFQADAAEWRSLRADLELQLPETRTSWGSADGFRLHALIRPVSATNDAPTCTIQLSSRSVDTPWGRLENWQANTRTVPALQMPLNSSNEVQLTFARLNTRWGNVENGDVNLSVRALDPGRPDEIDLTLDLAGARLVSSRGTAGTFTLHTDSTFNRTNALPIRGTHVLHVGEILSTNFSAAAFEATISQAPAPTDSPPADEAWGFWQKLTPYAVAFELTGKSIEARGVNVDSIGMTGSWSAPTLELTDVHGTLYGGDAKGSVTVDVPSREIRAAADVGFDFHGLDAVFTERFRNWFAPYQWKDTPHARVTGKIKWPDWRDLKPNWREDVAPTIGISGQFHVNDAFYRGIPGKEAFSDFHFTNFVWNLPNLTIVRPEGRAVASYDGDERTKDYVWKITADIDPHALKPLFKDNQLRVFDSFTNFATPHVEGMIRGRWRAHDLIGFRAEVTAPRTELRGEFADLVKATVEYTNQFLTIRNLEIQQSNRIGRAESLGIDLPEHLMYFTNVDSSLPPQSVARAIGPVTARSVEPYVFDVPPRILVNGVLGLKGHDPTDMRFEIAGGPFHWWRLNLDQIEANLFWRSNHLDLTNVVSSFYGGDATGAGSFQFFTNDRPTEFSFAINSTNAQLHALVRDVFAKTNGLEGALSGTLAVTSGRADSLDTWQGFGNLHLRDGVVWDIPIFGIFSPVFNAISPGLGQSRADQAAANYTIVNGTVISRDLQVRSAEFTMGYQGSVDFTGNVEARMQARILKDSGVLGPLISTALWPLTKIFEYRLTGTLAQPVAEPVHIPKFLFMALEPFKALQGVLRGVGEAVIPKPPPEEPPKP